MLTLVTGAAALLGVATVLAGVAWLRDPAAVHRLQVRYLGSDPRDERTVRRGALPRGIALVVLGLLCLLFVVLSI
jgi:uncharacterized membrane protein HdeD (DUF308 family)